MRNLIDFFARFHTYFLFLLLQVLSFLLIIRSHHYHHAGFFNTANKVTGSFYRIVSSVSEYLTLREINEKLAAENARLLQQVVLVDSVPAFAGSDECETTHTARFSYLPAKVVNISTNRTNNFITLNKGARHGVRRETGVISREGVVGIVVDVSEHFSLVMSLLHKKCNISVRLKKARFIGSLHWDGGSTQRVQVTGIPVNALVENGDTLVTSGFSSIFPENIPVGRIIKVENTATSNFFDMEAELFTNFHTLDFVYIIRHPLQDEQRKLEAAHE